MTSENDSVVMPKKKSSSIDLITMAKRVEFAKGTKKQREKRRKKRKSGAADSATAEDDVGGKDDEKEDLAAAYTTDMHNYTKARLAEIWKINLDQGYSVADAAQQLLEVGHNRLTPAKTEPWWARLLRHIFGINARKLCEPKDLVDNFFNLLLWIGAILCFFAYGLDPNEVKDPVNLYLGIVLSVVVTISGIFGYYQEGKSSDIMGQFAQMENQPVTVTRGGQKFDIDPDNLVPGDIITIKMGDRVPGDIRFIHCTADCEVNNASLTGESEPQKRKWTPTEDEVMEAKNLAFFGTYIVKGNGIAMIIKTGDDTFMGKIAALAQSAEAEQTPIAKEIKNFIFKISGIAFSLGISFFVFGMIENGDFVRNMIFLIAIIVANVPEGLLMTVTVSLTLTATRMREKNVQVKRLESVETLGSTSVICSDKTGTLTTSRMTVASTYWEGEDVKADTHEATNVIKNQRSYFVKETGNKEYEPSFLRLLRVANLNNTCTIDAKTDKIKGDSTETAITKFCRAHSGKAWDMGFQKFKTTNPVIHEIPFNSSNKWQVTIHKVAVQGGFQAVFTLKGAAERVIRMCDQYLVNGETHNCTEEDYLRFEAGVEKLGRKGQRVLAFADLPLDMKEYDINRPNPPVPECSKTEERTYSGGNLIYLIGPEGNSTELNIDNMRKPDGSMFVRPLNVTGEDIKKQLGPKVGVNPGCIRLYYEGDGLGGIISGTGNNNDDVGLADLKINLGCCIYWSEGTFVFSGDGRANANWPFARNLPRYTGERLESDRGLIFTGLLGMIDPPRPSVPGAVLTCQSAGIRVIMVTGDHPVTAHAIAKEVNIIKRRKFYKKKANGKFELDKTNHRIWEYRKKDNGEWHYNRTRKEAAEELYDGDETQVKDDEFEACVVSGTVLNEELQQDDNTQTRFWNRVLSKPDCVFARTSPQQKLIIVSAVQERGGIVAVTGDGVNDSPALKKADIGVAMGLTGTEVAKESADMILADDNFASIVNGVEEGRIIFDNLKKSIAYTLSSNIPEILPFLLYQTIRIPLPLIPIMILLVDLGTDLVPAISLAHENKESDIMRRSPRDPEVDQLVTWRLVSFSYLQIGVLQAMAGLYAYMVVLSTSGLRPEFLMGLSSLQYFDVSANQNIRRDGYLLYCTMDTACNYKMNDDFWFTDSEDKKLTLHADANQVLNEDGSIAQPSCRGCLEDQAARVPIENADDCKANANGGCDWNGDSGVCQNGWRLFSPTFGVGSINNALITDYDNVGEKVNSCFFLPPFPVSPTAQVNWFKRDGGGFVDGRVDDDKYNQLEGDGCGAAYGLPNSVCYGVQGANGNWGFANVYMGEPDDVGNRLNMGRDKYHATVQPARGLGFHHLVQQFDGGAPQLCVDAKKAAEETDAAEALTAYWTKLQEDVCKDGKFNYEGAAANVKAMYLNAYKLRYSYENQIYNNRDCKPTDMWGANPQTEDDSPFYTGSEWPKYQVVKEDKDGNAQFRDGCGKRNPTGNPEAKDTRIPGAYRTENYEMFPIIMNDREMVLRQANTAYFISIIVVQWADLMICKTRFNSLFMQGMSNMFMNWGLIFETLLGAMLVYFPFANVATETRPLTFLMWTPAIPFCALIFFYDEFRKWWIRGNRYGWLERNTYW